MKSSCILLLIALLSACAREPLEVYVPASEPTVELSVRVSAVEVSVGEPVTLNAERWNRGEWKVVRRQDLGDEQCWLVLPPDHHEKEVADNLRWEAKPAKGARFNTGFRADHTRVVVFEEPGSYLLESMSKIWCRPDKVVRGKPIAVVVRDGSGRSSEER